MTSHSNRQFVHVRRIAQHPTTTTTTTVNANSYNDGRVGSSGRAADMSFDSATTTIRRPMTRSLTRRQLSTPNDQSSGVALHHHQTHLSLPHTSHLFSHHHPSSSSSSSSIQAMDVDESIPSTTTTTAQMVKPVVSFNPANYPNIRIVQSNVSVKIEQPQSSQKIYTNERPCNIVTILGNSQLTGRMTRLFTEVSRSWLSTSYSNFLTSLVMIS